MEKDVIRFSLGDCPICEAKKVPLRMVMNANRMTAWICDPCLTKYSNRDNGGGAVAR